MRKLVSGFLLALGIAAAVAQSPFSDAGSCKVSDIEFSSEEGGCLDFTTGLAWSRRARGTSGLPEALEYCKALAEGSRRDWRLPTGDELTAIARERRAERHFSFKVFERFWSASKNGEGSWVVSLAEAADTSFQSPDFKAGVLCVRRPFDRDGDGVPDSSDQCNLTPPGVKVATTGPDKGCGPGDRKYRLPDGETHPCSREKEPVRCKQLPGCGWSHTVKICIDVWTRECPRYPDEPWCRVTPGCWWNGQSCVYEEAR